MDEPMTVAEIAEMAREIAARKKPSQNINTGVVYGGQHVENHTHHGDYCPGNKNTGKKAKKK
ncbi:hypothetical protein GTY67_13500 [Streptomyces sp. SID8374]|uniref:hypothetical protein n=1 Tax=Streptomyces sp. SID8374 TaxID=2690354 RepID=UPI00136CC31F|nr:hypothetical protein [Streptomyces sp. SID8374]MYX14412.1 hypothetical protein [Streptomyces sp. SID8374]